MDIAGHGEAGPSAPTCEPTMSGPSAMQEIQHLASLLFGTFFIASVVNALLALLPSIMIAPTGRWTPSPVRRLKLAWLITSIPAPVVLAAAWMSYPIYDPRGVAQLLAAAAPALVFNRVIHHSRVARQARWSRADRCPACSYRIDGLGDRATCPECGEDLSPEARRRHIRSDE